MADAHLKAVDGARPHLPASDMELWREMPQTQAIMKMISDGLDKNHTRKLKKKVDPQNTIAYAIAMAEFDQAAETAAKILQVIEDDTRFARETEYGVNYDE